MTNYAVFVNPFILLFTIFASGNFPLLFIFSYFQNYPKSFIFTIFLKLSEHNVVYAYIKMNFFFNLKLKKISKKCLFFSQFCAN